MVLKMKSKLNNQKGFTLVELLAVIVILGIIAAIAVPSIGKIIDNSKKDAAVSDALMVINGAKLAHAAGVGNVDLDSGDITWNGSSDDTPSDLEGYISNSENFTSVTYDADDRVYSIQGHDGLEREFSDSETGAEHGDATEAALLEGRASM